MLFKTWKLWEKLVFILGCSMVIVVMMGCIKLAYTHWRLRRYSAIAEKERKEEALRRQLSEARRPPGEKKAGEVLFGVRAIESGVEVEGVWISHPNTPELPGHASDYFWRKREMNSRVPWIPPLDFSPVSGAGPCMEKRNPSGDRHAAAELPRSTLSTDSVTDNSRSNAQHYPPLSDARYPRQSQTLYVSHSAVSSTIEGLNAIYRASGSYHSIDQEHHTSDSSRSSNQSRGDVDGISASVTQVRPLLRTRPGPRCVSADVAMLDEHRTLQAAETGQLTPRTRRLAASVDYGVADVINSNRLPLGYFDIPQARSSATAASAAIEKLPLAIIKGSIPDVTPFTQFVQSAPPSPRPLSVNSQSSSERKRSEVIRRESHDSSSCISVSTPPALTPQITPPACNPTEQPRAQHAPTSKNQRRHSEILRGHGTGFEILKPGSLPVHVAPEASPERQRTSRPPVSLQNFVQVRSRSRSTGSTGRKLQKKHRQSFDSAYSCGS